MSRSFIRDVLVEAFKEHGPMSAAELSEATGIPRKKVDHSIGGARREYPEQFFRIVEWRRQPDGHKGAMVPVYAHKPGKDKPQPKAKTHRERNADYRARKRAALRVKNRQEKSCQPHVFSDLILFARKSRQEKSGMNCR
jgi:hypothetical protein